MAETHTASKDVAMGTERGFAIVFCVVFFVIGQVPLWGGNLPFWWAFGVAAVFLLLGFVAPKLLRPLNIVWFKFGLLLHKVMSPVVLGILFFLTVTPVAWMMRLFGKDPLRLARKGKGESYWVSREDDAPGSFKNQF